VAQAATIGSARETNAPRNIRAEKFRESGIDVLNGVENSNGKPPVICFKETGGHNIKPLQCLR
jgi:hypothetical protein